MSTIIAAAHDPSGLVRADRPNFVCGDGNVWN